MFSGGGAYSTIKDLKDLSVFLSADTIDMQVLKDLKRCFSRVRSRGTGPRATGQGWVILSMRRSGAGDPELQSPASNLANRDNRVNPDSDTCARDGIETRRSLLPGRQ